MIRCCDYPSLANDRIFARVQGEGEPDGSCIDADGCLWNAQWGGAVLVRYAPDGMVERIVETPARQPSCVAIGGPGLDQLLCTSARVGLVTPVAADGALLALEAGTVCGVEENRFAGASDGRPLP